MQDVDLPPLVAVFSSTQTVHRVERGGPACGIGEAGAFRLVPRDDLDGDHSPCGNCFDELHVRNVRKRARGR